MKEISKVSSLLVHQLQPVLRDILQLLLQKDLKHVVGVDFGCREIEAGGVLITTCDKYSEDIDLVQIDSEPINPILKRTREVLDFFGTKSKPCINAR